MKYSLRRTRDGAGDSGPMSDIHRWDPETKEQETKRNAKPEIGWAVQVGSFYSRTFSIQDWWLTTPVTEILEEREDYVRFRTKNSEYEWKII